MGLAEHAVLAQVHFVVSCIISGLQYLPGGPMGPPGFFSFLPGIEKRASAPSSRLPILDAGDPLFSRSKAD
jgi:hypothetical protein